MDFFKSVFSEDPPSASESESESEDPSSEALQNPNPQIPAITNAWAFGSTLLKTIATKSESVIENYKQELEGFSSELKKETAIVRQAASRAVQDLPARLESGAAVAQTSLESVGQAIDNIGSTVSVIITHGKDSIFNANDEDSESELTDNNSDSNSKSNAKPYSRVDALIRAVQCDMKTYCEEPEEAGEYEVWKRGFQLEEMSEEMDGVVKENGVIGEIYDEVVPGTVDHVTFWSRYFFRIYRVRRAEEARVKLVKRAIEGEEEEELSWDVDDEEDNGFKSKDEPGEEVKENEEKVDNMVHLHGDKDAEECDSEVKSDGITEGRSKESDMHGEKVGTVLNDKMVSSEGKNGNISDFSVISSQRSSHEEEDLGWDEIEDIGSGDDGKEAAPQLSTIVAANVASAQKPLSGAEEDEDLTWDIEDDEEPIKS